MKNVKNKYNYNEFVKNYEGKTSSRGTYAHIF